ncbi:MAG: alpha-N-arabinofuranosidase [Clostridiales bacterium]|jgi:alpha-N-arabinofuranosidase|nr:alpha-N-arabinofuranosidase [Clostridiales bacterium]
MNTVNIFADSRVKIGRIEPALFGAFVEHLGRCVYTGIYEPGHPAADEDGFRTDVLRLVKGLNIPLVRYPGGNFVSGYNWLDGIGPKADRPTRLDLAWKTTESNQFGLDEFVKWCAKAQTSPMMAVNLGTGTPQDAASLVEYCNHPGGSYYSDLRKANGAADPYGIKTWCLGNEMDGPWQICGMSAQDYADKALAAAKMMRYVDPSIKLVACGSSGMEMPSFPEWDRAVLDTLYEEVDYISMHRYYWQEGGSDADFFASYRDMNEFIQMIKAASDYIRAKHRSKKVMPISFDEWNVWYQNQQGRADWSTEPHILEDNYSLKDALVFAGMMNTLINNCDRVKIACLAQLVNVIAPIFTEKSGGSFKQSTYYPFQFMANHAKGNAVSHIIVCEAMDAKQGAVNSVSSSISFDEGSGELAVFLVNYNDAAAALTMELRGFGDLKPLESAEMSGKLDARNSFEAPDAVAPYACGAPVVKGQNVSAELAPLSYTMFRFGGKK